MNEPPATFADLMRTEGKAELVNGRIVTFPTLWVQEARQLKKIIISLDRYAEEMRMGEVVAANVGFVLPKPLPSGRQSFCPDAAYLAEPVQLHESGFVLGAPTFAVEFSRWTVENQREQEQRIADYFAAGTLVVWDVDGGDILITRRRRETASKQVFHWDDLADAEPAVPGWRLLVKELLPFVGRA